MRPRRDRLALAIGGACIAHAALIGIEAGQRSPRAPAPPAELAVGQPESVTTEVALVALDTSDLAALPIVVIPGPGDAAGFEDTSPLPGASADLPGDRAADRGGGAAGGEVTWTGRRDPDQTALRAQTWSDPDRYRAPREDLDRRAATTEAIARKPDRSHGDRQVRARARAGEASPGEAPPVPVQEDPDIQSGANAPASPAPRDGATQRSPEPAMVDPGETAVDVERHGAVSDDVSVAAASDQRDPDPYDLTPARSGGTDEGVRGKKPKDGALVDGRGAGTGASRSAVTPGKSGSAIMASRTDPYLREILRRVEDEVAFPRDLKLDLRSGRVIVTLQVAADGRASNLAVTLSSGYDGFDKELVRAIKALGNLGKVPDRLLDGARALKLMVPHTFKNPMIR